MEKKLNPLQMVAREMSDHSDLDEDTIELAMEGLLEHLKERAIAAIDVDPDSDEAAAAAVQYRVACETIAVFGTQLIAFQDMEDDLPTGEAN
jgi:hypothetical protein